MKKILAALLITLLLFTVVLSACSSSQVNVTLGKEFTLTAGKTAVFSDASLKIKFVEVTADSRCPQGVQCIQAGQVDCLMLIDYSDSESSLVFTQMGGGEAAVKNFNVYAISFNVEPYPQAGKEIKPGDYKMVMTVKKSGQ